MKHVSSGIGGRVALVGSFGAGIRPFFGGCP